MSENYGYGRICTNSDFIHESKFVLTAHHRHVFSICMASPVEDKYTTSRRGGRMSLAHISLPRMKFHPLLIIELAVLIIFKQLVYC